MRMSPLSGQVLNDGMELCDFCRCVFLPSRLVETVGLFSSVNGAVIRVTLHFSDGLIINKALSDGPIYQIVTDDGSTIVTTDPPT